MNKGKFVEFIEQGKFVCTLCLQDKGNKLHLLTLSNREVNLSPKRAVLISGPAVGASGPREELLERLKERERTRNQLKDLVDVKELWELIRDERESFGHKDLAQLVFGVSITDDHLSALLRALFEDRLYFKMKDGQFRPNSEERIRQIITQREEETLKEERLKQGSKWLISLVQGKGDEDFPRKSDILRLLEGLSLYGSDHPEYKFGKELLARAGITDLRWIRNLLIRLGVWEMDENLDLLRSSIDTSFSETQLEESARLAKAGIPNGAAEDLRDLQTITIDGPFTRDYDDALSLEVDGEDINLGIHIADVAALISPESILDREAAKRGASLYLPRKQIPMIPTDLSQHTLSLKQGRDRYAISLLARFSKSKGLLDYRFVPSMIRIRQQLTYDQADASLDSVPALRELHEICLDLRKKRLDRGALLLSIPDVQISFNADSFISLQFLDQNTPSRMMVAECMILYNCLLARYCRDNQIPTLYRTQADPAEMLSLDDSGYVFYVFRQRRKLSPLQIMTSPSPHSGLGLDVYAQATSPIRRYLDLVVQRQIKGHIMGADTLYDEKKLEEIRMLVEPAVKNLELIRRNRERYWILKFLQQHLREPYKALVLDELKNKYRIVLKEFFMLSELKRQNGMIFSPGQEILVEVTKVDPWENEIEIAYRSE